MMTRLPEEIYSYYQQALNSLRGDHPHYEEVKSLLIDQVNEELHDYEHSYCKSN